MSRFTLPLKTITRHYAFKSDLKIKWVRPEKIPCIDPKKSGDLKPLIPIDKKQILLDYQNSKELQTANDDVKKLLSLEYNRRYHSIDLYRKELVENVKRHDLDQVTVEVKIAKWTGTIRALQELMAKYKNQKMKVRLKELIDKRKKHLKYLRRWDYKRFEWLLEVLDVIYKPPPDHFHWITRKDSLRKLTDKYCDGIMQERLDKYRLQLENEQPAFLEEKIRLLEFIRNEQKECGVEITVTQEEIDVVKNQLQELKLKNESKGDS